MGMEIGNTAGGVALSSISVKRIPKVLALHFMNTAKKK